MMKSLGTGLIFVWRPFSFLSIFHENFLLSSRSPWPLDLDKNNMAMWALHAVQTPHIGAIIFPPCSEAGKHCPYIGETLQHLCVPRKEIYELVKCICFRFIFETVRLFIFNYFSNLQVPENFDRQEFSGCLKFWKAAVCFSAAGADKTAAEARW